MARKQIKRIQTRIGEREVTEESILYFPRGIIGFENRREFTLLPIKEDSPFLLLQGVDDPSLGLLVTDPYSFMDTYNVKLGDAEKKILRLTKLRDLAILVTVTIPPSRPEETTLNLSGPVVINTKARIGLQVPQVDTEYPNHFRLSGASTG